MSKHTPGPWRVESDTTLVWGACVINHGNPDYLGYPVADAQLSRAWNTEGKPTVDETLANARLIAATPDLLHALKTIVANILEYERVNNLSPNPGKHDCWLSVTLANEAIAKAEGR